ncbi:hypothetical protein ABWK43_07720, partial [Bacillus thuringiensis]|uniref:hypothetical protein n=1 Tax=Bacillus thuringiensis TaxID=1428 RepID=UPI00339B4181
YGINVPRTKKNIIRANAIAQINFNINSPPIKNTKVILKYNYSVLEIRFLLVCNKNYRKGFQKKRIFFVPHIYNERIIVLGLGTGFHCLNLLGKECHADLTNLKVPKAFMYKVYLSRKRISLHPNFSVQL